MITLKINGKPHRVDVPPDLPVLWAQVLRVNGGYA
jgi:aerobic-type carbon monoxide dehydrogenase small subunit (CoxS/CutS family)